MKRPETERANAAGQMGRMVYNPDALQPLLERGIPRLVETVFSQRTPVEVRVECVRALRLIAEHVSDARIVPALAAVAERDGDTAVWGEAVWTLGSVGDSRAVGALSRRLQSLQEMKPGEAGGLTEPDREFYLSHVRAAIDRITKRTMQETPVLAHD